MRPEKKSGADLSTLQQDPEMLKGNFNRVVEAVVKELDLLCPPNTKEKSFQLNIQDASYRQRFQTDVVTLVTIEKNQQKIRIRSSVQGMGRLPIGLGSGDFILTNENSKWKLEGDEDEYHRFMFYLLFEALVQIRPEQKQLKK